MTEPVSLPPPERPRWHSVVFWLAFFIEGRPMTKILDLDVTARSTDEALVIAHHMVRIVMYDDERNGHFIGDTQVYIWHQHVVPHDQEFSDAMDMYHMMQGVGPPEKSVPTNEMRDNVLRLVPRDTTPPDDPDKKT